jgi:acyl carrier protein
MNNSEKYKKVFSTTFEMKNNFDEKLEYNSIEAWDSIGHMNLISNLEEEFKISLETDDIVDFSSFNKGKEILKKYKISF